MPAWLVSLIMFCAVGLALPLALLLFACRRKGAGSALMIAPFLAIIVLAVSLSHDARWVLLGEDYSHRLYDTILAFVALTLINAVAATARKEWLIAAASLLLSLAWFFVGASNSVA